VKRPARGDEAGDGRNAHVTETKRGGRSDSATTATRREATLLFFSSKGESTASSSTERVRS
jgi:hypothetical protein